MSEDQIAHAVAYLRTWTASHPGWQHRSAEDIAAELARDTDWTTIELGSWLQSPDGAPAAGAAHARSSIASSTET
jgi:hypothetical protein